ncbi:MAG: hypothetical protein SFV32_07495 [Opitutaceae bacterium]|nr:hypothetical protein [Opitutaceae bacterium]
MKPHRFACLLPLLTAASFGDAASFSTVGGTYAQDFDGLSKGGLVVDEEVFPDKTKQVAISAAVDLVNTGVEGWYMRNDRGSSANTEYRVHNGSLSGSAGRGVVSFGATNSNERALGALPTSNQVSSFALYLRNDTGVTLDTVSISYVGEQWRVGDVGRANSLAFSFRTFSNFSATQVGYTGLSYSEVPSLGFAAPFTGSGALNNTAVDGNQVGYRTNIDGVINLSWAPGDILALQWSGFDLTGQDQGLAIDSLAVSAIPEPSVYALAIGSFAIFAAGARRRLKPV